MTKVAENTDAKSGRLLGGKNRQPSLRAVSYVKNLIEGMSKREAALKAGYSESVADTPKSGIEKSRSVQLLMEDAGITPDALIQTLKDGLGATKLFGKEMLEYPDFVTRYRFMETGMKLTRMFDQSATKFSSQVNIESNERVEQLNAAFVDFLNSYFGARKEIKSE